MTPPIRHINPILQVLLSSIPVFAALPLSRLNLLLSDRIAPGSQCRIVHLHCQQNMMKEDQIFNGSPGGPHVSPASGLHTAFSVQDDRALFH